MSSRRSARSCTRSSSSSPPFARGCCAASPACAEATEAVRVHKEDLMRAQDLMSPNPVTVSPEMSVAEVWDLMREHAIRHIPVLDRGALVGMLSDRDLAHFDMAG